MPEFIAESPESIEVRPSNITVFFPRTPDTTDVVISNAMLAIHDTTATAITEGNHYLETCTFIDEHIPIFASPNGAGGHIIARPNLNGETLTLHTFTENTFLEVPEKDSYYLLQKVDGLPAALKIERICGSVLTAVDGLTGRKFAYKKIGNQVVVQLTEQAPLFDFAEL